MLHKIASYSFLGGLLWYPMGKPTTIDFFIHSHALSDSVLLSVTLLIFKGKTFWRIFQCRVLALKGEITGISEVDVLVGDSANSSPDRLIKSLQGSPQLTIYNLN